MKEELISSIISNLTNVGYASIIFSMGYLANILFGLWYNIKLQGQQFDIKRLLNSFLKIFIFILGTALVVCGITTIPVFFNYLEIEIPESASSIIDILVIIMIFMEPAISYYKEAVEKMKQILGYKPESVG